MNMNPPNDNRTPTPLPNRLLHEGAELRQNLRTYVDIAEEDFNEWWQHSFGAIGGTPETRKHCLAAWKAALKLSAERGEMMRAASAEGR